MLSASVIISISMKIPINIYDTRLRKIYDTLIEMLQ